MGKVLERIGIETSHMQEWSCCGSTILSGKRHDWYILPAYNLALAEKSGRDIITLCGSCTSQFKRANKLFREEREALENTNEKLSRLGLHYPGDIKVNHILEILMDNLESIRENISRKLDYKIALQHPCNVFRPGNIAWFDDPLKPTAMRELIELTGSKVMKYSAEYQCCGSTLSLYDESLGISSGEEKLSSAQIAGAQIMAVSCGNCAFLFDRKLSEIKKINPQIKIKTLFLTQLLGLSMGFTPDEMGIRQEAPG